MYIRHQLLYVQSIDFIHLYAVFVFINYVFVVRTQIKVLKVLILNRSLDKKIDTVLFFFMKSKST